MEKFFRVPNFPNRKLSPVLAERDLYKKTEETTIISLGTTLVGKENKRNRKHRRTKDRSI